MSCSSVTLEERDSYRIGSSGQRPSYSDGVTVKKKRKKRAVSGGFDPNVEPLLVCDAPDLDSSVAYTNGHMLVSGGPEETWGFAVISREGEILSRVGTKQHGAIVHVAASPDRVFVADTTIAKCSVLTSRDWKREYTFDLLGKPFHIEAGGGLLFLCFMRENCIGVYSEDGKLLRRIEQKSKDGLRKPTSAAFYNGWLFVAELGKKHISVFDPVTGELVRVARIFNPVLNKFEKPMHMAIHANLIFVSCHYHVTVCGLDGTFVAMLAAFGDALPAQGMCVDEEGTLFVSCTSGRRQKILALPFFGGHVDLPKVKHAEHHDGRHNTTIACCCGCLMELCG